MFSSARRTSSHNCLHVPVWPLWTIVRLKDLLFIGLISWHWANKMRFTIFGLFSSSLVCIGRHCSRFKTSSAEGIYRKDTSEFFLSCLSVLPVMLKRNRNVRGLSVAILFLTHMLTIGFQFCGIAVIILFAQNLNSAF